MSDDLTPAVQNRRIGPWIAAPVLLVLAGLIFVLATGEQGDRRGTYSALVGRQGPAISGTTIDGDGFDLVELRGKPVVVNFFATWCIPCVREHPDLVSFERRYGLAGEAAVVSIVYDTRPDQVRAFFERNGGDWPVVVDPDGRIALAYGVSGVPESYLLGADGVVLAKIVGGVTASGLDELLAELAPGTGT